MLKAADGGKANRKAAAGPDRIENRRLRHRHRLETQGNAALGPERPPHVQATQWRITHFTRHALKCITPDIKSLAPVLKGAHDSGKACPPDDPKPLLDLQPYQRPLGGG
ncbi:hypothetical protein DFAR_340038 [Desulfarculales bacterium]